MVRPANVENATLRSGSKRSTALTRARKATWRRSSAARPAPPETAGDVRRQSHVTLHELVAQAAVTSPLELGEQRRLVCPGRRRARRRPRSAAQECSRSDDDLVERRTTTVRARSGRRQRAEDARGRARRDRARASPPSTAARDRDRAVVGDELEGDPRRAVGALDQRRRPARSRRVAGRRGRRPSARRPAPSDVGDEAGGGKEARRWREPQGDDADQVIGASSLPESDALPATTQFGEVSAPAGASVGRSPRRPLPALGCGRRAWRTAASRTS